MLEEIGTEIYVVHHGIKMFTTPLHTMFICRGYALKFENEYNKLWNICWFVVTRVIRG